MTDDEVRKALNIIEAKRIVITHALRKTHERVQALVTKLEATPQDAKSSDVISLQSLVLQGKILVRMIDQLAAASADIATQLQDQTKNKKKAAPVIDMNEIDVPDYLPENL
jgi:hypothetical protein